MLTMTLEVLDHWLDVRCSSSPRQRLQRGDDRVHATILFQQLAPEALEVPAPIGLREILAGQQGAIKLLERVPEVDALLDDVLGYFGILAQSVDPLPDPLRAVADEGDLLGMRGTEKP